LPPDAGRFTRGPALLTVGGALPVFAVVRGAAMVSGGNAVCDGAPLDGTPGSTVTGGAVRGAPPVIGETVEVSPSPVGSGA
jgi:hypothetical protein